MAFETLSAEAEDAELERLYKKKDELKAQIAEKENEVKRKMQLLYDSGELEDPEPLRPDMTDQPTWDSPGHRTALRNMRNTGLVEAWYQYMPELFEYELLTETIMQGVWNDVRKSEKFDSGFKDRMRVKKRQYIRYSGDLTLGFHPNVTKRLAETHAHKLDELRKLANKRLAELGPDGKDLKDKDGKPIGNYFDVFGQDFEYKGETRNLAEEYQKLIVEHNAMVPEDERISDNATPFERWDMYYNAGQTMWKAVSPNLADDEFTLMPGSLRELYVVMRNMDENKIMAYRTRDLDVKIPMVEFFIEQFRDEVLEKRKATKENLELFTWFVNKQGQNFIPFASIRDDLKDWYEIIKSILGRPNDSRVQPSKYDYLQDKTSGGSNSKVMQRINEIREKHGLSKWTVYDTPFARIGVTLGYMSETLKPKKKTK